MAREKSHIILLGFKHTGKSTVGKLLAQKLQWPFIDLDAQIEQQYKHQTQKSLSCREIYQQHGKLFFRECEIQALRQALLTSAAVIALGGGAPMQEANQKLLQSQWLVHITAAPAVVYQRIMATGKPAYFPTDEDPADFFQRLWGQHEKIYTKLANFTIDNTQDVTHTVAKIFENWENKR